MFIFQQCSRTLKRSIYKTRCKSIVEKKHKSHRQNFSLPILIGAKKRETISIVFWFMTRLLFFLFSAHTRRARVVVTVRLQSRAKRLVFSSDTRAGFGIFDISRRVPMRLPRRRYRRPENLTCRFLNSFIVGRRNIRRTYSEFFL